MKKFFALLLTVVLAVGAFAGCGRPVEVGDSLRTITDGAGRQVEVPERVEVQAAAAQAVLI